MPYVALCGIGFFFFVLLRGFAGYGGHHPSHGLPSVATAGRPCEGWWRRWDSNPRPKRKNHDIYARILRLSLALGAARRRATTSASGHVNVEGLPATRSASSLLIDTSPHSRHPGFGVAALIRPREERRSWRLNFPGEGRGTLGSPARSQGLNRSVENLSPPHAD